MSGLAGDDYNDATEATRGAAAAPMPAIDFLSQGLGPQYDGMPVMGFQQKQQPLQKINSMMSQDSEGSPSKLAQPLMSIGQMSTQDQTPNAKPAAPRQNLPNLGQFQLPVLQRDAQQWRAQKTPYADARTREKFYFAPTHLQFDQCSDHDVPLHEIVGRVFEFAEREFAVEVLASSDSNNGTFDLACFVKTAMVIVKVSLWEDVELASDLRRFVVEMVLVDGCGITFCEIFRRFKRVMDPKGICANANADKDAMSTQAPLSSAGSVDSTAERNALMNEEIAMDGEQLLEFGVEFSCPSADEWESVLADCEVFADPAQKGENEPKCIAAAVESLASIACTYSARDLEYLAECVGERKIGLCHESYCDQVFQAGSKGAQAQVQAGECHRAGKNVLAQLWATAVLVKHLAKHQGNLEHLQKLVPALDAALRRLLSDSYEQKGSEVCLHTTVVHALADALCLVLQGCRDYGVAGDAAADAAFDACSKDANVQALFKQAAAEEKQATRTVAAAEHLHKAYECWGALRTSA